VKNAVASTNARVFGSNCTLSHSPL
jgi:hypothetical protein